MRNWEMERLSGLKQHGAGFTTAADAWAFLDGLLRSENVRREELQAVWGTPWLGAEVTYPVFAEDLPMHSFAHLFSAVMMESARFHGGRILCLAVDGLPDCFLDRPRNYYAGAYVDHGVATYFPVESPGRLYDSARELFGLRAGSLMALATASQADCGGDGEQVLGALEFWGVGDGTSGDPQVVRNARVAVDRAHEIARAALADGSARGLDDRFSEHENLVSMTMKLVQAACLRVMERNVDRAVERFGIDCAETDLALSGGFALNCPGNSHLVERYGFRGFLAPPCVNDSGQSIGLALAMFSAGGERIDFRLPGAYLGPEVGPAPAVGDFDGLVASVDTWDPDVFVADLGRGPVGWLEGASEVGPRALGHRSLLADPTRTASKDALNEIKRRQWWRPVAPMVLAEHAADWFVGAVDSPYMLRTFPIRENRRKLIPAVSHLDDSARVQTVPRDSGGLLRAAIEAFHAASGVPILCNTSLNDAGEPIIETVAEAVTFCLRRGVPLLYVNGARVELNVAGRTAPEEPSPREAHRFARLDSAAHATLEAAVNPHGLTPVELYTYLETPRLHRHDPTIAADAAAIRAELARWFAGNPSEQDRVETYLDRVRSMYGPASTPA
ncbi:carbamoyltransferase C-terminal domain-containing protein [Streptomyces sp.]|uniref:carbamoyltransferase C-terminal domain-containing protein n=1 Tax=Streptomyces sp. TaxID=1931 RepID=UPI002F3E66A3